MLTPQELLEIVDTLHPQLDELNAWITKDLIKRLMARLGRGEEFVLTGTDEWQVEVYKSAGGHLEDLQKEIQLFTKKTDAEVKSIFEDIGIRAWDADNAFYVSKGFESVSLAQSEHMIKLLTDTYQRTNGEIHNFTRTTAKASQQQLITTLDTAHFKVMSGAQSYTAAVKEAVNEIISTQAKVQYPTGHVDTIETAVLRAVRTGVGQASGNMAMQGMIDRDWDLIRTSAHIGARYGDGGENPSNHFWWQGKLFSRTGKTPGYAITFRGNTPTTWAGVEPTGDFAITPYADCYIIVKYGSQSVRMRAKRGVSYPVICPVSEALSDTEIYLYLASNIVEISSVAGLYCQYIDLAPATRLRKFIAGSDVDGYNNLNLTSISFGNNELLEYIDLRGTPALAHDLDLSLLTSLVTLYLTGSGVTGVTFALGAPVEVAELCAVSSLVARRLSALTKFTMDGTNLLKIWVEESPLIDTLAAIKAAKNLNRGHLPDVEWSTDVADDIVRLSTLAGLDENGEANVATFVLEGKCHIATVSQEELDTIMATFYKLALTYGTMVDSYTVTFQLDDGTVLNTQTVRQYGAAVNPVTAELIDTPVKESTVDTVYTFIGWDVAFNYILGDLVVTAVFSEQVRTYTVRFFNGSSLLQTDVVEAYAGTAYRGEELTSSTGAIWMGWDKPTNSVTSDMDVYALFVSPTLPDTVASGYDYLYSDNPDDNSGYTLAEFYGIIATGKAKEYFSVGDQIKIVPVTDVFVDSEIIMQVYGFNHYKLADGSGDFANVVFGMLGVMNANRQMNTSDTNVGGWEATAMRTFLNDTIYPALPQQWRAMIKAVEIMSSIGNTSAEISTSEDNLFLFSQAEVGFNTTAVPYVNEVDADAEEITFSIFTDNTSRIKKRYNGTGEAVNWWLRSPYASNSTIFCNIYNGGGSHGSTAGISNGVAFGFCI